MLNPRKDFIIKSLINDINNEINNIYSLNSKININDIIYFNNTRYRVKSIYFINNKSYILIKPASKLKILIEYTKIKLFKFKKSNYLIETTALIKNKYEQQYINVLTDCKTSLQSLIEFY